MVSRHFVLQAAPTEYQWLGLSSSRWKSFLQHMELPHPLVPSKAFPSTTLVARTDIIRKMPETRHA